jgi:hypothetical protein
MEENFMDEETRKNMEKSLQELKDLSPGAFQAFCWVITHWELAEEMVRDEPPVTDGDIEALARRAVEEGDYSPLSLALFKRMLDGLPKDLQ